jgi:chromosome segregation ATPase
MDNKPTKIETEHMKNSIRYSTLLALTALVVTSTLNRAADSAERAEATKEKIQALRVEVVKERRQIQVTMEELKRLTVKDVDLRPQFEKFKAELVKMEEQAKVARDRADAMKQKGQAAFADWEREVQAINNPDIRKEAEKRMNKRQKSYIAILKAMFEAKEELVPFMSNLNDIRKLLDSELTEKTVASTKSLIKETDWAGNDVRDSLADVEKELDRVTAELAKYK